MGRQWRQASWNHCSQLLHCSIFRYQLYMHENTIKRSWLVRNPALRNDFPPPHLVRSLTFLGLHSSSSTVACWSDGLHPTPVLLGRMGRTAPWLVSPPASKKLKKTILHVASVILSFLVPYLKSDWMHYAKAWQCSTPMLQFILRQYHWKSEFGVKAPSVR